MNCIELTHTNGDIVLINVGYITCVCKYDGEKAHALIWLVSGDKVAVQETYDEIIESLEGLYNGN